MKTVMQEIMFKAGRMIKHAGRWVLGLGANDRSSTRRQRLRHPRSPEVTALKRIAAVFSPKVALLRGFTPPAITVRRSPGHQPVHQFARGGGLVLAHQPGTVDLHRAMADAQAAAHLLAGLAVQ